MPDLKPATVLWPDLSRFGLELTVAYNPSLGRNFLRLCVKDRDAVASTSGLVPGKDDFFRVMRDAGFAYQPSETEARRMLVYKETAQRGASLDEQDAAVDREIRQLYFYSPSIAVKKDMLKKIVPALADSDFRQMPVSDIKHFDFRYIDDTKAMALFGSQQAFAGGEPGVFFTTPADRDLLQRLGKRTAPVRLYQPPRMGGERNDVNLSDPDMEVMASLNTVPGLQRFFSSQVLLADGSVLRTLSSAATILGYPGFDEAVAANGGDVEGIERMQLPEALPVAFDYPSRRVLAVKDGRFLEFGNIFNRGLDDLEALRGAQYHWDFLDKIAAVSKEVDAAIVAGVFDESAFADREGVAAAGETVLKLRELMSSAVTGLDRAGTKELSSIDLLLHSGINHAKMPQVFGHEFTRFIAEFPDLCKRVEQRHGELDAEAAMQAGIQAARARVHSTEAQPLAPARREDAGEKIGGARKDYARRWLDAGELGGMTMRERVEVVTKDNVWPAPDYAGMEARGITPEAAYCIRELRNALPTNPYRGGFNTKRRTLQHRAEKDLTLEQCENFVKAVSLVRDSLAEVKNRGDLLSAIADIRKSPGMRMWNYDHWFCDGAGYHFTSRVLPDMDFDVGGNIKSTWHFDRFMCVAEVKTEGGWKWAGKKQRVKIGEDESLEVVGRRERPEPEVSHLDHIERVGENFRQGRDVDEQMLMEVFGFRAVEYGNWLPQNERQAVLNHSFDAFMDLATALKLPPKAMSLGGDLALAFGSRGRGGKDAARAHYEPARNVVNLTRLSGAGALAHEWGHGLDYFLAKSCDVSQTHALTERAEKTRHVLQPIAQAFMGVVEESRRRFQSKEEIVTGLVTVENGKTIADLIRSRLENFVGNLDSLLPEDKRGTVFREFAMQELDKAIMPVDGEPRLAQITGADSFVHNLTTALDLQLGSSWKDRLRPDALRFPARIEQWARDRCAQVDLVNRQYDAKRYPAESVFLMDSVYFDSFRSKPYWSTRVEMFARAFESWVQDRVECQPGQRSQYLVHGNQENVSAEHSGTPRGEERVRINSAMDVFFRDHRMDLLRRMGIVQPELTRQNSPEVV